MESVKTVASVKSATIFITKNPEPGNTSLVLFDTEGNVGLQTITTKIAPGGTITWKIANESGGITEITNICKKNDSQDVFQYDPTKQEDGSWLGVVSSTAKGTESYNIGYVIDGVHYLDDPDIDVEEDDDDDDDESGN
ncbi:hypothetical protein R9C00_25300 [Flammeovirgaceae bacterium SG7u.111]|nr:hypothetical protein [Flammeovirgaceae bacterium SG7u.132]WPO35014.1 hypothetical protein R9C00_25300 [Flammeovirgaceae bacterium SG7u.111]